MLSFLLFSSLFCCIATLDVSNKNISALNQHKNVDEKSNETIVKNTTESETSKNPDARSLKMLTPGEEFLLSIASFEDTKGSNFESLPYLMSILQNGKLGAKPAGIEKKQDKMPITAFPMRLANAMKVMTATENADGNDDDNDAPAKPTGFLAKLAEDPMNILLAAIIPFSLLLAAVIPLLVSQFTNTAASSPPVTTIAAGTSKSSEQRNFIENFVSILEGIASFGSRINKEMLKENGDKKKTSVFSNILQLVTSLISEKWLSSFSSTPVHRLRSCNGSHCSGKK